MSRLQSELQRLYLAGAQAQAVRALVIELTRPPSWESLSRVWHGVQSDLELPAPAIAVSGTDGLQLWFSLEAPIALAPAQAFVDRLQSRFLQGIDPSRIRLIPNPPPVPARQEATGNWSAFVAPDLAPIFAETPWLDIPPNEEGQANLLRGLKSITPQAFEAALKRLAPQAEPSAAVEQSGTASGTAVGTESGTASEEPRAFLLRVMNDDSVALSLRIEAAKALLS